MLYAITGSPAETAIVVISSTKALKYTLSTLHIRGYHVVLLTPDPVPSNSVIRSIVSRVLPWNGRASGQRSSASAEKDQRETTPREAAQISKQIATDPNENTRTQRVPKLSAPAAPVQSEPNVASNTPAFHDVDTLISKRSLSYPHAVPAGSQAPPPGFQALVDVLNELRRDGNTRPSRKVVYSYVERFKPSFHELRLWGLRAYIHAAAKNFNGVVITLMNGKGTKRKIELDERYVC